MQTFIRPWTHDGDFPLIESSRPRWKTDVLCQPQKTYKGTTPAKVTKSR